MAEVSFRIDPQVAEIAVAYAQDAVELASTNFGITLDMSESSILRVEQMLGRLHDSMATDRPTEDLVWTFAQVFGSYIGEVIRRHHGGEWGIVEMHSQSMPGILQPEGSLCWPWVKAHNRLVNGPEDNVWHYYLVLTKRSELTASTDLAE